MALNRIFIEKDRFYFGISPLFTHLLLVVAGLSFTGFGAAGLLGFIGDVPPLISGLFLFFGCVCVFALIANILGFGLMKSYESQPSWGADRDGIFLLTPEGKISRYDWGRIEKIKITDAIKYAGYIEDSLIGETWILHSSGRGGRKIVTRSKAILIHIDKINEMEGKIAKAIFKNMIDKVRVIAMSYSGSSPTEVTRLLKKYAPSDLVIERVQELKLDG